jgi:tetratricopeptide (TPR) repeat protein
LCLVLTTICQAQTTAREWCEHAQQQTNADLKLEYANQALALEPRNAWAYQLRGVARYNLGQKQEAIADYDEAIRLDPKSAPAYNNRGVARKSVGQYNEALADYNAAIRLDRDYAAAYNNRGIVRRKLGQHQEALTDFNAALRLDPEYARAYLNKGQVLVNLGRYADAVEAFRRGEELDPALGYHQEDKNKAYQGLAEPQNVKQAESSPAVPTAQPVTPAAAPTYAKRHALVIGNSSYDHGSSLEGRPLNDARDVAKRLEQVGFSVLVQYDLTQTQINKALQAFGKRAEGAEVALFYFAGHGYESEGVNYLIPKDATLNDPEDARLEAISLNAVLDELRRLKTKVNLVYLDACRDNPFRSWSRGGPSRSFGVVTQPLTSTMIYYAASPGQVAQNGSGRNGVYTSALLRYLQRGVSLTTLTQSVMQEVAESTRERQVPYQAGTLYLNFVF